MKDKDTWLLSSVKRRGRQWIASVLVCGLCFLLLNFFHPELPQQQQKQQNAIVKHLSREKDAVEKVSTPRARRLESSPEETTTTVILNVGLPRLGSINLHRYLQCLGICSHHYCCSSSSSSSQETATQFPCPQQATCGACLHTNVLRATTTRRDEPPSWPLEGCGHCSNKDNNEHSVVAYSQFDVESSAPEFSWFLPQHFAMPLLVPKQQQQETQQQAMIWILPRRTNATVWAQSVLHWHSVTRRLLQAFDVPYFDDFDHNDNDRDQDNHATIELKTPTTQSQMFAELVRGLERSQDRSQHQRRQDVLERIYEQHLEKVTNFVQTYNQHHARNKISLVQLNVDDPNAGSHLTSQLLLHLPTTVTQRIEEQTLSSCWEFDAQELDHDWKNFSLPF